MTKVGITGGIGSGKTTVARLVKTLGFPVYDADFEAKQIINADEAVRRQITELLGEEAYNSNGYNRQFVAGIVFKDKVMLSHLNRIVHPVLANHFSKWCTSHSDSKVVFQEAAILFENGSYTRFDKTILVTAPELERLQRVMQRDGLSRQQVKARINNQWTDQAKMELADFVVHCDGKHLVIPQVLDILNCL